MRNLTAYQRMTTLKSTLGTEKLYSSEDQFILERPDKAEGDATG